jgi:translation elongation factor EF-G
MAKPRLLEALHLVEI